DPDLPHQLDPGDAGVDGRDRRGSGLEAARRRSRRVVVDVHLEDVAVGKPPGRGWLNPLDEVAAAVEKAQPSRAEQVLEHSRSKEIAVERPDVDRDRAHRLVRIEEDESPALVRKLDHTGDVGPASVAEADVGDRDKRRLLVDRGVEAFERDRRIGLRGNVDDAGAAALLRMPDLTDRRELEIADHDFVAPLLEAETAGQCTYAGRDRG